MESLRFKDRITYLKEGKMSYRFEYQRPNKHNQSEWKINVVKAHELYILLNGFSFYKNVQTLKLISKEKSYENRVFAIQTLYSNI